MVSTCGSAVMKASSTAGSKCVARSVSIELIAKRTGKAGHLTAREGEQLVGQQGSALGRQADLFHVRAHRAPLALVLTQRGGVEAVDDEPGVVDDHGQQVVEVVGDAAGALPEALQTPCVVELVQETLLLRLGLLVLLSRLSGQPLLLGLGRQALLARFSRQQLLLPLGREPFPAGFSSQPLLLRFRRKPVLLRFGREPLLPGFG